MQLKTNLMALKRRIKKTNLLKFAPNKRNFEKKRMEISNPTTLKWQYKLHKANCQPRIAKKCNWNCKSKNWKQKGCTLTMRTAEQCTNDANSNLNSAQKTSLQTQQFHLNKIMLRIKMNKLKKIVLTRRFTNPITFQST
jgi:hypothetical protein